MARYLTDADIVGTSTYGDDSIFVDSWAFNTNNLDTMVKEFFNSNSPEKKDDIPCNPPPLNKQKNTQNSTYDKNNKLLLFLIFITFITLVIVQKSNNDNLYQIVQNIASEK